MIPPPPPASFARSDSLPEQLAAHLRDEIVQGRLAPGARMIEAELAAACGVSRVPLREAFRILALEGLIDLSLHRGATVRPLSDTELRELFGVRTAIESYAASVLAQRRDKVALAALRKLVTGMRAAVVAGDTGTYQGLAAAFHETFVEAAGNALLAATYRRIRQRLRRYQVAMSRVPHLPRTSIAEHEAILVAIAKGEAAQASALSVAHLESLVRQFTGDGGEYPQFTVRSRATRNDTGRKRA